MPKTFFISGHLDLTPGEFAAHYVPPIRDAVADGARFVVGDARGADTMAQALLMELGATVTVFHMYDAPRNNLRPWTTVGGFLSDSARDEAMTEASSADIGWVRLGREKSGTAKNLARRSTSLSRILFDRAKAAREYESNVLEKALAALAVAPTVGRCGFAVRFRRHEGDVTIRCTKTKHATDDEHAVTNENGEAIIAWSHPTTGGGILRGVIL